MYLSACSPEPTLGGYIDPPTNFLGPMDEGIWSTGGGGRGNGPYADSLPLSDHFQGGAGGGGGWVWGRGGRGAAKKGGGGGRLHTLTNMA